MADGVLIWAERQRAEWIRSVDLMQSGKIGTHEGSRDTTEESIAFLLGKISELDALIAKHGGAGAY